MIGVFVLTALVAGFLIGWITTSDETVPQDFAVPMPPPPGAESDTPVVTENTIIRVSAPEPGVTITSPVFVSGEARTFEANVQIRVRDDAGNVLAHTFTTAQAPDVGIFGSFQALARYQEPTTERGVVEVFEYSAKDGSEINVIALPVVFASQEFTTVSLFFSPQQFGNDCADMIAVARSTPKAAAIGRAAIEELLQGPTTGEREAYAISTNIPPGVMIRSFSIQDGTARVDFDRTIETGGACRVTAIRAQITETLKQFPSVNDVVISVDGNAEGALQP